MEDDQEYKATVTGLSNEGLSLAFVDISGASGSFLLSTDVWQGNCSPKVGEVVFVSGLRRFPKGWRAGKARPFTMADEQSKA